MNTKHTLRGLSSEDIFDIITLDDDLDIIQEITTAVNSHDDLIGALKEAIEVMESNGDKIPDMKYFRYVIEKAGAL